MRKNYRFSSTVVENPRKTEFDRLAYFFEVKLVPLRQFRHQRLGQRLDLPLQSAVNFDEFRYAEGLDVVRSDQPGDLCPQ